jgi:hypothetical protein
MLFPLETAVDGPRWCVWPSPDRPGCSQALLESAPPWLATAGNIFNSGVAGRRLQHIWRPNGAISGVERRKTGFIV